MSAPKISYELRSRTNSAYWMTDSSPVHILWLRCAASVASHALMEKFAQSGLNISVFHNYDEMRALCDDDVDLCIIETADQSLKEVKVLVKCIRAHSHVPLILLSDQNSTEWVIQMLIAGVDAVIAAQTPTDVIFARAKALLRRWRPQYTV